MHWWMSWQRLGSECNLREVDWIHQLNACMNHRGYLFKYLEEVFNMDSLKKMHGTLTEGIPSSRTSWWSLTKPKKSWGQLLIMMVQLHHRVQCHVTIVDKVDISDLNAQEVKEVMTTDITIKESKAQYPPTPKAKLEGILPTTIQGWTLTSNATCGWRGIPQGSKRKLRIQRPSSWLWR